MNRNRGLKMYTVGQKCFYRTLRKYFTKCEILASSVEGLRTVYTVRIVANRDKTYKKGDVFQTTANWLTTHNRTKTTAR